MSDEIKNGNGTAEGGNDLSIADKLSSAAKALSDADAGAKVRREEEQKTRIAKEKEEKERLDAEAKLRLDEERQTQAILRKKQAEMEYAENYRKKLREQKARNEALAANRRAAQRKAEEDRLKREAEEAARENAMREGLAEAEKRNAESDLLLELTSDRVKEKEKAAEELEKKIQEARDKAEKEAAEALLRSLEGANEEKGPIIVTAEGIELFPGSDGYDEAVAAEARRKAEADAENAAGEEASTVAEGEALRSEALLAAIKERLAQKNEPAAEESPIEDTAPTAPDITQDYILGITSSGTDNKTADVSDNADNNTSTSADDGDSEEDFLISIGSEGLLSDMPEDETEADEEAYAQSATAEAPATAAQSICNDTEPKASAPIFGDTADKASQSAPSYLFRTSTYDMITADTDFGDDYTEKKKSNTEALQKYRDADGGVIFGESETDEVTDTKGTKGKKNKKGKKEPEYRYDAGGVFSYGEDTNDRGNKNKPTAQSTSQSDSKGKTPDAAGAAAAVTAVTAIAATAATEKATATAAISDNDGKVSKLLEEKSRLEEKLRQAEEKNREEIANLTEKEQQAKRTMLQTDFEIKEAQYRREIDELNAKLEELEREHNQKREELQSSISQYESRNSELLLNSATAKAEAERDTLEKEAADSINTASIATLSTGELKRFLNRVDSKDRKLVSRINSARSKYKKAKNKSNNETAPLYELIGLERELLESYIISYRHTLEAKHKKYSNIYQKKVNSLVKDFNKDLSEWQALTGIECDMLPKTLAKDIKDGKEVPPIPAVYLPDKLAESVRAAGSNDEADAISDTADKLAGQTGIESLGKKELNDFLGKQDSTESKLEHEINNLRKKQKNAKNAELARYLKPCIEKEAELLESYVTDYRYIIAAKNKKYKKKYANKISSLTAQYNSDLETWRALTDTPVTLFPKNAAKLIEKGEEVPSTVAINTSDKITTEGGRKESGNASSEREDLLGEVKRTSQKNEITAMSERDLITYLNKSDSKERKLRRAINDARRKHKKAKGEKALVHLKACVDSETELIECYIEAYRCTLAVGISKYIKRYSDKLSSAIKEYNRDTKKWHSLTDTATYTIPSTLPKDIANGKETEPIRTVEFADKPTEENKNESRHNKSDEDAERTRVLKEEADRERGKQPDTEKKENRGSNKSVITKSHMKSDIRTLEDKIDYRCDRYSRYIELNEYRYGEQKKKDKRSLNEKNAKLRSMKRGAHAVISARRKDNARYLEIVNTNISDIKTSSKSKIDRLTELKERIENLLIERDEVNTKLDSLYAEENLKGKRRKRKSYRTKLAEFRLSEVKRAFKKQRRNYRKISKFRVTLQQKQNVYDAINKHIELSGYLAECRYRLKYEKPKGNARRLLKKEISETKKSIKHAKSDINYGIIKNGKRSAKTPNPKKQVVWLVLLLLIIGAGVAIYIFRAPIWAWITQLISAYLPSGN